MMVRQREMQRQGQRSAARGGRVRRRRPQALPARVLWRWCTHNMPKAGDQDMALPDDGGLGGQGEGVGELGMPEPLAQEGPADVCTSCFIRRCCCATDEAVGAPPACIHACTRGVWSFQCPLQDMGEEIEIYLT